MVRCLCDFCDETLDLGYLGGVGGDGNGDGARSFVGEGVEGGNRFFTGLCFSRGNVDLGATGLQEPARLINELVRGRFEVADDLDSP